MDKNLEKVLEKIFIDKFELEEMCERCPGLKFVDSKRVFLNIKELVLSGLEFMEVGEVVVSNPNLLLYDPAELAKEITKLGKNANKIIKNNPSVI